MGIFFLILGLLTVNVSGWNLQESRQQRIVGGDVTTIDQYPSAALILLYSCFDHVFSSVCGASIISDRAVLTAAHCISDYVPVSYWQTRVGSSFGNRGGFVHQASKVLIHPEYNSRGILNDIGIIQTSTPFTFSSYVSAASFAGRNYYLPDNEPVTAIGWGMNDTINQSGSEQLNRVHLHTINWNLCDSIFREVGSPIGEEVLCIGIPGGGVGGQCAGDSGSPVYHYGVIVGVCSWGHGECDNPRFPHINAMVSRYADWIVQNS
ncbi:unnamed protein product [Leptosia nina]|uniref:Peptidase S1 domain-containing protein n=1 Tax=Leptosia nina TaxID=320188 RepID=A0AAV1IW97_9NEOP